MLMMYSNSYFVSTAFQSHQHLASGRSEGQFQYMGSVPDRRELNNTNRSCPFCAAQILTLMKCIVHYVLCIRVFFFLPIFRISVQLPLQNKLLFGAAPFEVYNATLQLEMSATSVTIQSNFQEFGNFDDPDDPFSDRRNVSIHEVRADILTSTKDERELVVVRKPHDLDQSPKYSIITPSPHVTLTYDTRKEHCSKFELGMYIEVRFFHSVLSIQYFLIISPPPPPKKKKTFLERSICNNYNKLLLKKCTTLTRINYRQPPIPYIFAEQTHLIVGPKHIDAVGLGCCSHYAQRDHGRRGDWS